MVPTSACGGFSAALAMLSVAAAVHGQNLVLHVDDDAQPGGDGSSWAKAFGDLQLALNFADQYPGHVEVRVAEGVYTPDRWGTMDRESAFRVRDVVVSSGITVTLSMAILGGFVGVTSADPDARDASAHPTVLSGDLAHDDHLGDTHRAENSRIILKIEECNERLVLDGLTITGTYADQAWGAAVHVANYWWSNRGGPVFRNCRIIDNRVRSGAAGVHGNCRALTFERCLIARNTGVPQYGITNEVGGVWMEDHYDGYLTMRDTWLIDNSGYAGGAVSGGGLRLERCVIAGNTASWSIGGVGQDGYWGDDVFIENCLFAGNTAGLAGGALLLGGWTTILNCTFVGNSAEYGGAIFQEGYDLLVRNCVLVNNRATSGGPNLAINNLFARTQVDSSCVEGGEDEVYGYWRLLNWDGSVLDVDPLFRDTAGPDGDPGTWADNDYRLAVASPCVDAGNNSVQFESPFDLDGLDRFSGNQRPTAWIDMGCYELQNPWCFADFNGDGFVDGIDADRFNNAFESGSPYADVNRDGYIDGLDFDQFFQLFNAGC